MPFECHLCGTIYQHEEFAERCRKAEVLDDLNAAVGEKILRTIYVGDDYAQSPHKGGIKLLYCWTFVREKRLAPPGFYLGLGARLMDSDKHVMQYKLGNIRTDKWALEMPDLFNGWEDKASGRIVEIPIGPSHYWSKHFVERVMKKKFPDYIIEQYCQGRHYDASHLDALKNEGYYITDGDFASAKHTENDVEPNFECTSAR